MSGEADDSWLETAPTPAEIAAAKAILAAADVLSVAAEHHAVRDPVTGGIAIADDDWLNIEDANAGKVTRAFDHLVNSCMRGTDRVMATDGKYLAYRPYNREKDKETNPRTKERMNMFLEKGYYDHVGTYDEVEIYELRPGNPYYHDGAKAYVVGTNYWGDIRAAAKLACERKWPEYHDFLGGMATAMKGGGRDPAFAKTIWEDTINQIVGQITQMRANNPGLPTEKEINEGFIEVRRARGIQGRNGVILLDSNKLQKVEFTK